MAHCCSCDHGMERLALARSIVDMLFCHPFRYVGDMLAWLHQATASEKEHLEALLKQVTLQGNDKLYNAQLNSHHPVQVSVLRLIWLYDANRKSYKSSIH